MAVFIALSGMSLAPLAQQYTVVSAMPVAAEIVVQCVVTATVLEFGPYLSNSAVPVLGQASISLLCTSGTVAEVALDAGAGPGRNTSRRQMAQETGADRLAYGLFQDAGRTLHWGDTSGSDTLEVPMTGSVVTVPVYGQIPAGQRAREGAYSDTITVQVQF
ncbi:MAG: spore coat U domain-containing protein [Ramlibacter sp.]|nr:spore coat U domain-containing protein [Ramlibacter sp.]